MNDKGFFLPSKGEHVFGPDLTDLYLRIPMAALGPHTEDAEFHLTSKDTPAYDKTLSIKDDLVPGDDFAQLVFEQVFTRGRFTLEVNPGGGRPKLTLFKERSFLDLSSEKPPEDKPPQDKDASKAATKEAEKAEVHE